MRIAKINFSRNVGQVKDESWVSLSEDSDGHKISVRTKLCSDSREYTEWNADNIQDPGYIGAFNDLADDNYSPEDGVRILYPGTSRETQAPFSLTEEAQKGILGEIQGAILYDEAEDHLDSEEMGLYDFIEWYQQETSRLRHNLIEFGPEAAFEFEEASFEDSLKEYFNRHYFDGADLQSGSGEIVGHVPKTKTDSILRQTGLDAVNGIVTENPEEIRKMVDGK